VFWRNYWLSFRNHNRVAARVFSVGYDYSFTGLSVIFSLENVLIVMGTIVTLGFIASLIASSREQEVVGIVFYR
jgi:hypothetical protein